MGRTRTLLIGLTVALATACAPPPPAREPPHPTAPAPHTTEPAPPDEPAAPAAPTAPPAPPPSPAPPALPEAVPEPPGEPARRDPDRVRAEAERQATPAGRAILTTARRMIGARVVVRGSCWSYANAVYQRAGFPSRGRRRATVFKGSPAGPYADVALFRPGDWLSYVNHGWGDVPHSAIFVGWIDRGAKVALMVTYRGGRRRVPGRYREYDLSSVYRVIRPREP